MTRKNFSLVTDGLCDPEKNENIAVAGSNRDPPNNCQHQGATPKQPVGRRGIPNYIPEEFQEGEIEVGGRGLQLVDLMGIPRTAIASLPGLSSELMPERNCFRSAPRSFSSAFEILFGSPLPQEYSSRGALMSGKRFEEISLRQS